MQILFSFPSFHGMNFRFFSFHGMNLKSSLVGGKRAVFFWGGEEDRKFLRASNYQITFVLFLKNVFCFFN